MMQTVLYAILLAGAVSCSDPNGPIVNTPLGSILGTVQSSWKGFQFYSFRGIRYAEAPINDLRFKPPVPVKQWNEVFDATEEGPACYQPDLNFFENFDLNLSEDCLRLNVYTRRITDQSDLRPVLVSIHGGAFGLFSGQTLFYGPDYLMDHDLVLVTINYRLGTLGFFSTGDKHAPGNYGMKDQVQALKWVRENIRYFGGDPNRVTISGESAGAVSVGLHLISPMSRGLFHGAIEMSGGTSNFWAVTKNPMLLARKQAALLNCTVEDSQSMVDCMKNLPADQIANIYPQLAGWNIEPIVIITPVIENDSMEPFLTKDPTKAMLEGDAAQVPVLIGITKDEFALRADVILRNKDWAADLSQNWNKIAPIGLMYEPNDVVSQKLRKYYLGSLDQAITNDSVEALRQLYADATITFGVVRSAKLMADRSTVYLYRFDYEGQTRAIYWPKSIRNISAVSHGDILMYLFHITRLSPLIDKDTEDGHCVDRFTTLFKNFIETGNPTPEPQEILNNVIWTAFTNSKPSYLEINNTLKMAPGIFFEDRMSFWEKLYPLNA